jgi:hypothetical protein
LWSWIARIVVVVVVRPLLARHVLLLIMWLRKLTSWSLDLARFAKDVVE